MSLGSTSGRGFDALLGAQWIETLVPRDLPARAATFDALLGAQWIETRLVERFIAIFEGSIRCSVRSGSRRRLATEPPGGRGKFEALLGAQWIEAGSATDQYRAPAGFDAPLGARWVETMAAAWS